MAIVCGEWMMMTKPGVILLVASLLTCDATAAAELKSVDLSDGIVVRTPVEMEVVARKPAMPDFDIFQFRLDGAVVMGLYLGNFPSFPSDDCESRTEDLKIGEFRAKVAVGRQKSARAREILVDFGPNVEWPRFAHFWLQRTADSAVASQVEEVVRSIRIKPSDKRTRSP